MMFSSMILFVIIHMNDVFKILNYSNVPKLYKPIIEIKDISSDTITIKNNTTDKEPFIINNLSNDIIIDNGGKYSKGPGSKSSKW